ncbi:MAG: hypothetical protein ACPG19_01530 [Saprospiraceae bacterium]
MKTYKIGLVIFLIICSNITGISQQNIKTLASQIKKNISKFDGYPFKDDTFDADSLSLVIANQLVRLLKKATLSEKESKEIGLELSVKTTDSSNIRIYNFWYTSGGSRASITHPVIQWTNKEGKLFAYNFSKYANCEFTEINRLSSSSKRLYLLTGHEPGNGACVQGFIYTIQIKGGYLILDYPAFVSAPYLGFCNVQIDFDKKKQQLDLSFDTYRDMYYHTDEKKYLKNKKSIQKLDAWFTQDTATLSVKLKFNGNRFRKVNY